MVDVQQFLLTAGLIILFIVILAKSIKKITGKKFKPVKVIALEGQGLIKKISILDMIKDGDILKDNIANKQLAVVTSPVEFENGKKTINAYVADFDKGVTINLQKAGSVTSLQTNPELVSNVIDSRLISDAFGLKPYRGVVVATALVSLGIGFLFGLAF